MSLKVVTPERVVLETTVDSLTAMTDAGEITVLPGHVPIVSTLRPGEAKVKVNGKDSYLAISTGFLEVRSGNEIVVLADTAERFEELELDKIRQAKERAVALMEEKRLVDDVSFASAAAALERELAREKVAMRRHLRVPAEHPETQP